MTNSWDFTNLASVEVASNSGKTRDPFLLEAKPANGINNEYEMDIRFLFYPQNAQLTRYQKNIVKISNPISDRESVTFDCPRTIGTPSIFSDLFFLLKGLEKKKIDVNAVNEINKKFSRWTNFYSPVYVINDPIHPENNNQCKVLTYGFTIDSLITEEQKGSKINGSVNVFDYLTGKNFYYKVYKEGPFPKYDKCRFRDTQTPFTYLGEDGNLYSVSMEELQAMAQGQDTPLKNLLMNKLPDMNNYVYKAPSDDVLTTAAQYLRMILAPYPQILNDLLNSTTDSVMKDKLIAASGSVPQPVQAPQQTANVMSGNVQFQQQPTQSWQPQAAQQMTQQQQPTQGWQPQVAQQATQQQQPTQSWQPQATQQVTSAPVNGGSVDEQQKEFDNLIGTL